MLGTPSYVPFKSVSLPLASPLLPSTRPREEQVGGAGFCPIHRWKNEDLKFYFFILSFIIILSKGSRNPLLELGETEYLLITEAPGGIASIFAGWNNTVW